MITLYNDKDEKIKLISTFEFTESDMGESSISATVLFDAEQDFHPDWYVVYNGERFRLGVRKPTGRKDTSSLSTSYTLVFKSEREDLKRYTFMDFVELGTDNPQPNSYNVPLYATLTEFVDRFNVNLRHYMGDRWAMVLPEDYVEDGNAISMSFDNVTLWDVLLQVYEIFGVRWVIREVEGVLQIQVGFPEEEIEHIFEYGKDNGLVSIERNNSLERIVTRLRGRGSEKNLPPDYFHTGDADTTPELQAMYFKNLMPKVFRDYIRGYKAGEGEGTWAYNQGVADKVAGKPLNPVDYVISENEDLWGVSYGAIKPNEKIFPTLQGATRDGERLDEVVFVEEVLQDGVAEPLKITNIGIGAGGENTSIGACGDNAGNYAPDCTEGIEFTMLTDEFSVDGEINTVSISIGTDASYIDQNGIPTSVQFGAESKVLATFTLELLNTDSVPGEVVASYAFSNDNLYTWKVQDVAPGKYRFRANVAWSADIELEDYNEDVRVHIKSRLYGGEVVEYASEGDKDEFKQTFDIEIKDVWGIAREEGESDEDYTYRVWGPLAVSEEMSVMFSDGLLAGEDYEFRIAGFTIDSDNLRAVITNAIKPIEDGWRLTLQKSDVEIDAGGKYLPNTMQNAKAGDHFFFINIAMPYDPYVYDAEARVDADLHTQLSLLDEEFPSFTISPSKIFCSTFSEVGKLQAGAKIRIRNAALIGDSYTSLYIQSLTKRYSDKSLNPEWNITVSDQIVASGNPVSTLEGNVKILSQQVYNNRQAVKEAIRAMSSTFLRKDGISDVSYSPTEFAKKIELGDGVVDKGFNRGDVSGKGFGVYTDSNGNRVVEADILVGRIGARFNEVKINQVTYSGGKQVFSAAGMVVSKVVHTADGWQCFFDTKQGSEQNLFEINDGAFSQRFSGSGINQYWARVIAIGPDYITISKTDCMSENYQPFVGDNIAQLGNSTNKARQAAIVIDVVRDGGGLITWYDDITGYTLNEKDSINIGRVEGKTWLQVFGSAYIGARDESEYVKYENGKVTIKGKLEVGTTLADGTDIAEAIRNATPEGYDEFVEQVTAGLGSLQQQIDGAIESYFYEVAPTLENEPAIDWDTTEEKEAHLNDTYTNLKDGRSWRWTKSDDVYGWTEITDTATAEALRKAGEAQDTADGKRRVFITEPTTPYDEGDLWAAGSSEPLKRCISSRESGDFNAEDWDYADNNSELASQIAGYEYLKKALKESTTIDGGMIQSSILVLGYTDADEVFHIMSGTNGIYNSGAKGGGIAAWYGGDMVDAEDGTGAQSLFRFDGSGYLAGGNIRWDKEGAGAVAGGDISWDEDGNITLGNGIKISADGDETLGSLLIALNNKFDKKGGEINGNVDIKGKLSMSTLVIPNAEGIVGEHTLMIGEVGAGAATPEGGGSGTADFSQIKVYDTNGILLGNGSSSGKITMVPYPVVPTKVSAFENDAGYLTSHQDISGLATKTELESKVDKVDGKGLSTEDFTTALKTKLQGLSNYDDKAINDKIDDIQGQIDTLVSGDAATAIESFNEIIAFLDGVEDTETLEGIIAAIEQQIADKVSTKTFNALAARVGTAEIAIATNATAITNLKSRADGLQTDIQDMQDDVAAILDDYLSKANGGIIKGAVTIKAALKMNTLYLPNSNNTPSDYQMSVGVLGSGADTPSGGSGADVSSIVVYDANGVRLGNGNSEGNIVIAAYPTSLPASDVYAWAKKSSLAASDVPNLDWSKITSGKPTTLAGYGITDKVAYRETLNNFMHSTNEFTFAAPAYSSYIWMNYRTASGALDGAITEYRFAKGAGQSYADIRAAKYIVNGGTSSQFLKADGSLDGTSYLPLSGGTMANNAGISWTYNVHSWDEPADGFECISTTNDTLGYYAGLSYKGYYGLQIRAYGGNTDSIEVRGWNASSWGTWRTIIHSGNIGNQSVASAQALVDADETYAYKNQYGAHFGKTGLSSYINGYNVYLRYGASSTTGLILNSSGNVTIGGSDLAGTDADAKLCIDGGIAMKLGSNVASVLRISDDTLHLGYTRYASYHTKISGWNILLNPQGNVLIGTTTDDSSRKLQVYQSSGWAGTFKTDSSSVSFAYSEGQGISLYSKSNNVGNYLVNVVYGQTTLGSGGTTAFRINDNGNVLIGTTTDNGSKVMVQSSVSSATRPSLGNLKGDIVSIGSSGYYGLHLWNEGSGRGFVQVGRSDGTATAYDLILQPLGGAVGVNTDAPASTLHVNGSFRAGSSMLDSLTVYGSASLAAENKHYTRLGDTSYNSGWYYGTAGNEAMAFINNAAVSSFMFVQGKTAIENWDTGTWQSVTPALQIKQNCVAINYLWGQNVTPDYTLRVVGTAYFSGNISASGYQLPTSAPSNPVSGGYYLYVGTLGTGATIS